MSRAASEWAAALDASTRERVVLAARLTAADGALRSVRLGEGVARLAGTLARLRRRRLARAMAVWARRVAEGTLHEAFAVLDSERGHAREAAAARADAAREVARLSVQVETLQAEVTAARRAEADAATALAAAGTAAAGVSELRAAHAAKLAGVREAAEAAAARAAAAAVGVGVALS